MLTILLCTKVYGGGESFMSENMCNFYQIHSSSSREGLVDFRSKIRLKFEQGTPLSEIIKYHFLRCKALEERCQLEISGGILTVYFYQVTEKVKRDFRVMFEFDEELKLKDTHVLYDSILK